jgi:hypothetical protein
MTQYRFKGGYMKRINFISIILIIFIIFILQGCQPTKTHEETVTLKPSNINTLNETMTSDNLCRGGTAPDLPGPGQIITGFFHRYNNDDRCWVNQIYQGLVRFQVDAAPFNKRLIKSATLTLHADSVNANPGRSSCIDRMALTDIEWWALPNTQRIHINDLQNLRSIPPATDTVIDVTQEVQHWASGRENNNGFVFIGQRPEMSDFSNEGMLTNETCEAFYGNMSLTVTFFQFDNPPTPPSITVHSVHTQTTSDITVTGDHFTPNGSVHIFADDVQGRMGSFPLGNVTADSNGHIQFFNRSSCVRQPTNATIRALDDSSGDNARGYASVYCY